MREHGNWLWKLTSGLFPPSVPVYFSPVWSCSFKRTLIVLMFLQLQCTNSFSKHFCPKRQHWGFCAQVKVPTPHQPLACFLISNFWSILGPVTSRNQAKALWTELPLTLYQVQLPVSQWSAMIMGKLCWFFFFFLMEHSEKIPGTHKSFLEISPTPLTNLQANHHRISTRERCSYTLLSLRTASDSPTLVYLSTTVKWKSG